jgi:hypothetical protein
VRGAAASRSTFINLAEMGGADPSDVARITHPSVRSAKDLYRREGRLWPRLCAAVRAIQLPSPPSGEVTAQVTVQPAEGSDIGNPEAIREHRGTGQDECGGGRYPVTAAAAGNPGCPAIPRRTTSASAATKSGRTPSAGTLR